MHRAVAEACLAHGDVESIAERIEYLRIAYASEKTAGPPRFADEETRLAYAAAYHPAHAFAYLHLLLRRNLGDAVFANVDAAPTVMVLGAGPGAETLAMLRWMQAVAPGLLEGARFVLVDRADWQPTRKSVLAPTVPGSWKSSGIVFDQFTTDLATVAGEDYLREEVGRADVIFCPSILSEMISERTEDHLMGAVHASMAPRARLLLVDHKDPEFEHVSRRWSRQFEVLEEGSSTGVIVPQPTRWVAANLLDGRNNRIPTRSYPMMWTLLGRS